MGKGRIVAAGVGVLALVLGLQAAFDYSRARDKQLFGDLVHRVETSQNVVALTFDDGPTARHTPALLSTLKAADIPATFFVMGRDVAANEAMARAIIQAGHEVGNHSWDHPRMVLMTPKAVRRQLQSTDEAIRAAGYEGPIHVRPPYGRKLVVLPWVLEQDDRLTVMWSVEPETILGADAPAAALAAHVVETATAGDIILLHGMYSTNQSTRDALPMIIDGLQARGFSFVTVSDLLTRADGR